ncbi:MAG: histidine kinase [Rhodocyclaceae bacterium]|nr:MAG: histidine kinase [Rhodocyclaceae bacterium]
MLKLQYRIMLLTVLPMLVVIAALAYVVSTQTARLADQQASLIEERFLASRREELTNYVHMATTAIEHLHADGIPEAEAKRRAQALLKDMNYGDDGYFFVYDYAGTNLVHPRKPAMVGNNWWDLRDPQGVAVIQGLIEQARKGGGYLRYQWEKPSNQQMAEKIGYVVPVKRWGWVLGTGLYLDDVERTTRKVREDTAANIHATMLKLAAIAAVSVLVVFAGGIMLNVSEHRLADHKQKELTQRIVTLQEEERSRVARELHDGISQLLVSIKFQFELAEHKMESGDGEPLEDLRKGLRNLGGAIAEVRRISHDLRPTLLDDLGPAVALEQLLTDFATRSGMVVNIRIDPITHPLPENTALTLFRIAQEALTNIERHAHASQVEASLCEDKDNIRFTISDNGVGFNVDRVDRHRQRGIGLRNMRERIEYLGGRFLVESQPGSTTLSVMLPARMGR